jgi:hypothetical protein
MQITAIHILGEKSPISLNGTDWQIEFGEGYGRLFVAAGPDGKLEVRSPSGDPLHVEPRASNLVWVFAVRAYRHSESKT